MSGARGRALWAVWSATWILASLAPAQTELRGFWADAFQEGFKSSGEIQSLVSRAQQGRYNAIFAEVLAYHDDAGGGHGAYWDSALVPHATDVAGGIDPLGLLCAEAHAAGLEVHAWIVPYRASSSWPPSGNGTLAANPEWLMVPRAAMGGGPAPVGSLYTLDPGSPDVQEYLAGIVEEILTRYPVDGLNLDYVRYTQADAGYPAFAWYDDSSLARYRRISGTTGTPASGDPAWSDFRRRTISELVRRCRAAVADLRDPGRAPVRLSADLIAFGGPPASFSGSSAYGLFQDWESWLAQGWLDAGIPMNYKREHCTTQAFWYHDWVDAALGWRADRHLFMGQATYLNGFSNSVSQLDYALDRGCDGVVTYSYAATRSFNVLCDGNDTWVNDWSWYPWLGSQYFLTPAATPSMPWRSRSSANEGTIHGRVVDAASGLPVDDAVVQVGGLAPVRTDANGRYLATLVPAVGSGNVVSLTATAGGLGSDTHPSAVVVAGELTRHDFLLGASDYRLEVGTLLGGALASVRVRNASPGAPQHLLFSVTGLGQTWYAPLGLFVGLDRAKPVGVVTASGSGAAAGTLPIPVAASGRALWLQVAEPGRTSDVVATRIHP